MLKFLILNHIILNDLRLSTEKWLIITLQILQIEKLYLKTRIILNNACDKMTNDVCDRKEYYCSNEKCPAEYEYMPNDSECERCGALVLKRESPEPDPDPIPPTIEGENGLGIIVMDFSGSMEDPAFPKEPEYTKTKASVIASALKSSIVDIKNISKADKAYVALIGFTGDAELLGIFKASEINTSIQYWNNWFEKQIDDVRDSYGYGTNITNALKLARKLYDGALQGNLKDYNIDNFAPMYHNVIIGSDIHKVANIRVFIYSDGIVGEFINYFENASIIPGKTNVSGVTSAFLGNVDDKGYEAMDKIAGVCPIHGVKAVIHVNKTRNYGYLRNLFHMASSTSGFCIECTKGDIDL